MSASAYIATIVSVSAFMLGAVIAIVVFIGGSLGEPMNKLEARFEIMDSHLRELREDVAVLKATR